MLGLMFYLQWPTIPRWTIGVLVGASAARNGVTLGILWLEALDAGTGGNRDDSSAREYWKIHS